MVLGTIPELSLCVWLYFFIDRIGRVRILQVVTIVGNLIMFYMMIMNSVHSTFNIYAFSVVKGLFLIAFDSLLPYTCEIYNTSIRSIAFSFFNIQARISGSMMPLIVFPVFKIGFT
jgi:hypothetical protein